MYIFFLTDDVLINFFLLNFSFDADLVAYSDLIELLFFLLFDWGRGDHSFIHGCYNTWSILRILYNFEIKGLTKIKDLK